MSWLEPLSQFLFNPEIDHKSKTYLFIIGVILLIGIDQYVGFSYFHFNKSKLESIKLIAETRQLDDLSDETLNILKELENSVLYKKRFPFNYLPTLSSSKRNKAAKQNNINIPIYNLDYWHIISSSWLFILIFLIVVFGRNKNSATSFLSDLIFAIFTLFVLSYIFSVLLGIIPRFKNLKINYAINASVPLLIFIGFPLIISYFKDKDKHKVPKRS